MVVNSFDSFNDIINYNYQATIVDVDISVPYSSTGINAIFDLTEPPPTNQVPEPSTLIIFTLAMMGLASRRMNKLF